MGGRCVGWGGSLGVGYPMGEGLPWVSRGAPAVGCCILGGMVAWGGGAPTCGGWDFWGVPRLGVPIWGIPQRGELLFGGSGGGMSLLWGAPQRESAFWGGGGAPDMGGCVWGCPMRGGCIRGGSKGAPHI